MVKPIDVDELLLRIEALLRRARIEAEKRLTVGSTVLDAEERSVYVAGQEIALTVREFDLLYKLAQNEHIVLSRDKLLETVWGYRYCGDARTVDTHIKSLREHIGPYRKLIQSVWGVGYKFETTEEN